MAELMPDSGSTATTAHPLVCGVRVLDKRFWTLTTEVGPAVQALDAETQGIVVRGSDWVSKLKTIRGFRPDLPVMVEPPSCDMHVATVKSPLWVPIDEGGDLGLFEDDPCALYVQAQRDLGVSLAVAPTGQIAAQDWATLKALVDAVNALAGPLLVPLVVSPGWLSEVTLLRQLIAAARRMSHPVALGLIDGNGDPLERKGVATGYRRFFEQVTGAVPWRADLSGLGAVAAGAPGLVIGQLPSQRRFTEAGRPGHASNPKDKTPAVLLADLARYSRAGFMHTDWFAHTDPIQCSLRCCQGRALDRFSHRAEDVQAALAHNHVVLSRLARDCFSRAPEDRMEWFKQYLQNATVEHLRLGDRIGKPVSEPGMFRRWREAFAAGVPTSSVSLGV